MIAPVPEGARCASHPDVPATWTCRRCGRFMCAACERRVRPDALPLCPSCWEFRAKRVEPPAPTSNLGTTGLVLGFVSLLPLIPIQIASIVVNAIALSRGAGRRAVVGLVLTLVGLFGSATLIVGSILLAQ